MIGLLLLAGIAMNTSLLEETSSEKVQDKTIFRLVSRSGDISVLSTTRGVRFSATDARGGVLASRLSLAELHRLHPEIHRQLQPALCESPDASISLSTVAD